MCLLVIDTENCGTCARGADTESHDNGHCAKCLADAKPGKQFPGYEPKAVKSHSRES